jgi:hypothetical protein
MAAFHTDFDKIDHRTRVLAYLKAMEGVAQAYPNDDEAQILYAIERIIGREPAITFPRSFGESSTSNR